MSRVGLCPNLAGLLESLFLSSATVCAAAWGGCARAAPLMQLELCQRGQSVESHYLQGDLRRLPVHALPSGFGGDLPGGLKSSATACKDKTRRNTSCASTGHE